MPQPEHGKPKEPIPTQAELDAMPPFERFKWLTRHALSAHKDSIPDPFHKKQKSGKSKRP